jgi:hypothetical protein
LPRDVKAIYIRAFVTSVVFTAAAASGIVTFWLALALVTLAGIGNFFLEVRRSKQQMLPRQVLDAVIGDTLQEFHRVLADCPLQPAFGLWVPTPADGSLSLYAADSEMQSRLDGHRLVLKGDTGVIQSAYTTKQIAFQSRIGNSSDGDSGVRYVDHEPWQWRVALPVFDVIDRMRVTAVLSVEGGGEVAEPADLEAHEILDISTRAVSLLRRMVSVVDRNE